MVKIAFELQADEDGYPPVSVERLWAREKGSHYEIDNIPFFVKGVNCCDIVSADRKGDELRFQRVEVPSGHSTLRVVFFKTEELESLRSRLKEMGCATELSHLPNLIAVDVPPEVEINEIFETLKKGEHDGLWEYEEASIRHP